MRKYNFDVREKAILTGLYLSRFDKRGLDALGFSSFNEAYNVIALALNYNPNSIKNYRDDCNLKRKREMREYIRVVFEKYKDLDFQTFTLLIKEIIYKNGEIDLLSEQAEDTSFAKRIVTGQAAETFFFNNYKKYERFKVYDIEDTTKQGCGFDFKLHSETSDFLAVEVKGLQTKQGNILLTEKEYKVADILKNRYFIYVVANISNVPTAKIFQEPLNNLTLKKNEIITTTLNWSAYV